MNKLKALLRGKPGQKEKFLSVYFTAGFPHKNDTAKILRALAASGVDIVEIGMPFSDPVADGETIQGSNQKALDNGMSLRVLLGQLREVQIAMPLLLMGYLNPILQYGVERFCAECADLGIAGLILPDLPLDVYEDEYREIFQRYDLINIFLITPRTSDERIRKIDAVSEGFIYVVSSAGVTGSTSGFGEATDAYFERVAGLRLRSPLMVGFGVHDAASFQRAAAWADGAIVGSAFIKALERPGDLDETIAAFIADVRPNKSHDVSV